METTRLKLLACVAAGLFAMPPSFAAPMHETFENSHFKMVLDPLGGRIRSLYSKDAGVDLTVPTNAAGLFTESSWDRWHSRGKLANAVFDVRGEKVRGGIDVSVTGQAGGPAQFLRVGKRYVSVPESTALTVEYSFINAPDAMSLQAYSPDIHLSFALDGRVTTFFYATEDGICGRGQNVGSSLTCTNAVRGWYAAVDVKEGVGAAITLPYETLHGFRSWLPGVPSSEIQLLPVGIENGEAFKVNLEVIPFKGLSFVSGAGGGLVGSLGGGVCKVVNSRAGRVVAHHDGRETVLDFDRPGALRSFETTATQVRLENVKCKMENVKCKVADCVLDAKPAKGKWRIEPERKRNEPFRCEADLSCYTNFPTFGLRPWAKPLAGGPVKVAVVTGRGNVPEIGALAECFDMEYRVIGVNVNIDGAGRRGLGNPQYSFGDVFGRVGPKDIEREVNKVLSWEADAILLGGVPLDALPDSSRKIIADRVKAGAGLVLVGNDERDRTDFGAGRVVKLEYPAAPRVGVGLMCGITPDLYDFYPDRAPDPEGYYSRVAKAILESVKCKMENVKCGSCAWVVYNSFREKLAEGKGKLPDAASLPKFSGALTVEYSVLKDGRVTFWDRYAVTNAPPAAIVALTPDSSLRLKEGDTLPVAVKVAGDVAGVEAEIRFSDVFGRLLDVRRMPAAAEMKAEFRAENALKSRSYMVVAELFTGGRVVSRRRERYIARPAREKLAWDDFEIGVSGNSETRYYLFPQLAKMYKEAQIVTVSGQWPVRYTLSPFYDFNTCDSTHIGLNRQAEPPEYAKTGDKFKLVRSQCISDPKRIASTEAFFEKAFARDLPTMGYRHHGFGDEQSLTGHEGTPIDFCFSEHCLREFRAFAKARYGTLERLNKEYDSNFGSWDEVVPFTRQEVWKANDKHVAGWSDHLEFMDDRVTNMMTRAARVLRNLDPDIGLTLSGTQPPAAYTGMDWWKILQILNGAQSYGIGGQYDIHRSFRPDGHFTPWAIGYGNRGDSARRSLWETVVRGQAGVDFWWARSGFNPDFTQTHGISDILADLKRAGQGAGKYAMNVLHPRHEIAILYSQASFRGAFIEERRKEHNALHEAVRTALRQLGVSFDYISYAQLADGSVQGKGYKVLLLVDAVSMSDAEIEGVRTFAKGGASVVAFGQPGTRTANCRLRAAAPLEGFFGGGKRRLEGRTEDADDVRAVLRGALADAGIEVETLRIVGTDGKAVERAIVYAMEDAAGNMFWGVSAGDFGAKEVRCVFPKKGWVYDIVDGKAYGNAQEIVAPYGKGHPHGFVQLAAPTGMRWLSAQGSRVAIDCGGTADTVVRVTVRRPDGTEAECYAANVLARGGRAEYNLPFALSDPPGEWKVTAENILGGASATCILRR